MTDRRDDEYDDEHEAPPAAPRSGAPEGVRILGAEEAQAVLDTGAVGKRLGDHDARFGDVPPRPDPSLRPTVRFPLPADETPPELASRPVDEVAPEPGPTPPGTDEGVTVLESTGSTPLPHWTEPPTGEMPQILPEAEPVDLTGEESLEAYTAAAAAGTPRFRTGVGDWISEDYEPMDALGDETTSVGALADVGAEDDDAAFDREVAARRRIHVRPDQPTGGRTMARRGPPSDVSDNGATGVQADLTTRVVTGVGLVVLALICFKLGSAATTFLATAVVGLAALELFSGLQRRGFRPATIIAVLGSLAIVPIAYKRGEFAFPFTLVLVIVFSMLWYLFEVVRARPVVNVAVTVMGFVYVGVLGGFAGLLLSFPNGVGLILGVGLCVVAYDVVGYLVGSQFGKTHLAPAVSPNKTVEGLIGGMAASIVVAILVVNRITPWNELGNAFALGVTVAVMAPLGDLCESMLKRDLGVKDFGTILPGHGGVLDRFDALLFCLPAVYYLARALTIG